ncbi:MAG TPA: Cys-tRNA(Pro) deacylase [Vicinamibacterales bacterium]|nr:Cys-tRNA(Pro) deacylase [Vicinamibacterales bacterium]
MTPAIRLAERARIVHRIHTYDSSPDRSSFGEEAAAALGVDPARVLKTLVVELDSERLAVGVIPVLDRLNLKLMAAAAGAKAAAMADQVAAERATGYVIGGISPLAQKRRLPLYLDERALAHETIHVSGGRRGLELELSPADLLALSGGSPARLVE